MNWNKHFSSTIPTYISAIAAGSVAYLGFVTLEPVVENLNLRQQNRDLHLENGGLGEQITRAEQERDLLTKETGYLEQRVEQSRKESDRLSIQIGKQQEQLTSLAATLGEQLKKERNLTEQIRTAQARAAELEGAIERLQQDRSNAQADLTRATDELKRLEEEFKATIRLNRRFILTQIKTKAMQGLVQISYSDDVFLKLFSFTEQKELGQSPERSTFKFAPNIGFFDWMSGGTVLNFNAIGKEAVLSQIGSKIFDLLPVPQRVAIQDEIRNFVKLHDEVLSRPLALDLELYRKYSDAYNLVTRTPGSKYYDEEFAGLFDEELVPVENSEIKTREMAFEEAKLLRDEDAEKVNNNISEFAKMLDLMISELGEVL